MTQFSNFKKAVHLSVDFIGIIPLENYGKPSSTFRVVDDEMTNNESSKKYCITH